ncbi:unnamed protein product, partial [marine sediment metagenome]
ELKDMYTKDISELEDSYEKYISQRAKDFEETMKIIIDLYSKLTEKLTKDLRKIIN